MTSTNTGAIRLNPDRNLAMELVRATVAAGIKASAYIGRGNKIQVDGAAVDAQGHYWICGNDAGQIHAFDAQGQWCQSLTLPMPKPSMCAFGGAELDHMFVTSIIPANTTDATRGPSGAVIALQPGVRGMPEPIFSRFPTSA